ncbi:DUF4234 domain-containing protein [Candidatus Solincola sp.]|jgi:hypothetical protein|nr:DUF4234 domain-containing protein [Actinomycetota bacterium]MDI7251379.1 DUF4234 domain-containing protein [Actinomycetota bacterium]
MEDVPYAVQAGNSLEYQVGARASTDFITDPGTAILLSIVTCGIYGLYIVYKLVQRRDEHFRRMAGVADAAVAALRARAQGREELIAPELAQLEQVRMQMAAMAVERGAAIWLLICMFTGIGYLILYYLLMQDYVQHDVLEAQFFTLMSGALAKLGLAAEAGQAVPSVPRRDFVTFLILTLVTCGIYGLYWMYVMIKDFNDHFMVQVPWEDFLVQALR